MGSFFLMSASAEIPSFSMIDVSSSAFGGVLMYSTILYFLPDSFKTLSTLMLVLQFDL
jgi:hypothetical protein